MRSAVAGDASRGRGEDLSMDVGTNSITSDFGLGSLGDELGDAEYESLIATRPPSNSRQRQMRKNALRSDSQHRMYLKDLQAAWNAADRTHRGFIDFEQWKLSSFRFIIRDGKLSPLEFNQYFEKIDANNDGKITWAELIRFLIQELQSDDLLMAGQASRSLSKSHTPASAKQHFHKRTVKQILESPETREYITISSDAVRFWTKDGLLFRRELKLHDSFSCGCVLKRLPVLAIATETRRVYFYGVEELDQMPIVASASPSPNDIRAMKKGESRSALSRVKSVSGTLFNIPVVMMEACLNQQQELSTQLIVGDDCGFVEFFTLTIPRRRLSKQYGFVPTGNKQMHDAAITKISAIEYYTCYATSSADGTVKFWRPNMSVTHVFNEGPSVSSFLFCPLQRALIVCGSGQIASVWSTEPVKKSKVLMDSVAPSTLVTEFVTCSGDQYFVTFNARKELFLWDGTNMSLKGTWKDDDYLPPDNAYGDVLFDSARHCMVVASGYPMLWGETMVTRPVGITHLEEIVGCHYSNDFDQLVTVDVSPTFIVWDYNTGERKGTRKPEFGEISASSLDPSGRRLLTVGCDGDVNLWNFSSGTLIDNAHARDKQQVTVLMYFAFGSRNFFVTGGWSHTVYLYHETDKAKYKVTRVCNGHKDDVSAAAVDPGGWLVTCSVLGEVFLWSIDGQASKSTSIELPIEAVGVFKHHAVVADSSGYLTVLSIPELTTVTKEKGHPEIVRHAITTVSIDEDRGTMLTGDTLGYVRLWELSCKPLFQMNPQFFIRCSDTEITKIVYVNNFFVTASVDMAVRLWSSKDGTFVGTFGIDKWMLNSPISWKHDSPVSRGPDHFEPVKEPPKPQPQITASTPQMKVPKLLDSPSMRSSMKSIPEAETAAEEEHEFDWEKAEEMLQQLSSGTLSPVRQMSQPVFAEPQRPSSHLIDFNTIPMRGEPQARQMMNRIRQLQEAKPYKLFEPDLAHTLRRHRK